MKMSPTDWSRDQRLITFLLVTEKTRYFPQPRLDNLFTLKLTEREGLKESGPCPC